LFFFLVKHKMKFFVVALLVCLAVCASGAEYEEEDNVLVLTEKTFDEAIKEFNFILVEFYAPWCGHCKSLAPEYAAAAKELNQQGAEVRLAKVDATVESALGSRFEVKGYPTLKFFVDGEPREYSGGRTKPEIVSWLKKKTGPAFTEVKTVEEAEKFVKKDEVTVIGFFKVADSEAVDLFKKVAQSVDEVPFALTTDDAIRKKYKISSEASIVMFRSFEEETPLEVPDELDSVSAVKDFILNNILPKVVEFTDEVAPKIFGGSIKVHSLLFLDASSDIKSTISWYKEVADQFSGRVMFIYVDVNKPSNARIVDYFGIKSDSVPDYRLIEMGAENMNKFKPTGGINKASIIKMLTNFENNNLEPFYKSADVPENWDSEPVKVLVGSNFKEVAFDEDKNVLVEFYAPWCGHCKSLAPVWDELGAKLSTVDNVVIAKIDATENEIPDIPVSGFPTIKFFPAGSKSVVDYEGGRDLASFLNFLAKKGVKVPEGAIPAHSEDDDEDGEEDDEDEANHDEL